MTYKDVASSVWKQYKKHSDFRSYCTVLSMQGMARLSKLVNDEEMRKEIIACLQPFLKGEVPDVVGAYGKTVYRFGGNASAFLLLRGFLPEAKEVMLHSAELLCNTQPRDKEGLFSWPHPANKGMIWIDSVFGVCPFLLWTGLALGRQDFIDESVKQMLGHHRRLFDASCKLYWQARNILGDDRPVVSHWSRGNGWGLLALAEMVYDLPKDHCGYGEILQAYRDVLEGCLACQDADGMWHQAMEEPSSYAETSGTGLILYAISRGLKNGAVAPEDYEKFHKTYLKGLRGDLRYVSLDGSVFHASTSCLAPGPERRGTAADYVSHPWALHDEHAAGPQIMMLSQAEILARQGKIPELEKLFDEQES